jgi:aminopeptidase
VEASADSEPEFLADVLDTDAGARRIGELGIGCNPGITRYLGNVYFDEKIAGSVHIALGSGFADLGGANESAIHWDLVKDLRGGGRIELDGAVVQENGRWLV